MSVRDIPRHWKARIEAYPDSEKSQKYLEIQRRLQRLAVQDRKAKAAALKSHVGTRLLKRFKETVGAVPCSACKNMIIRLNLTSVSDIRANHEAIVIEIEKNARKAKASWWATIMIKADELFTHGIVTRLLISKLLSEACDDEDSEAASGVLVDHHQPAGLGGTSERTE